MDTLTKQDFKSYSPKFAKVSVLLSDELGFPVREPLVANAILLQSTLKSFLEYPSQFNKEALELYIVSYQLSYNTLSEKIEKTNKERN